MKKNTNDEFALIAVWKAARPYEEQIELEISNSFELVHKIYINWTKKNFNINSYRLYENPFFINNREESPESGHLKK